MTVPHAEAPAPLPGCPAVRRIGLALAVAGIPHAEALRDAIVSEADDAGCEVLIADTRDKVDTERAVIRQLRDREIGGLLLTPAAGDDAMINHLVRLRVPTVLVGRMARRGDVDQVGVENIHATSTLVQHLAAHGHRRIGLISGSDGVVTNDERALGYRLGVGRSGLRYDPRLVAGSGASPGGAAQATARLLDRADPPTALVLAGESMLIGAQFEMHRRGIALGSELAVAGFGDPPWAAATLPPLTTLALPVEDVGRRAVRMLLARAADPKRPDEAVRLPPRLMRRASCGCPSAG